MLDCNINFFSIKKKRIQPTVRKPCPGDSGSGVVWTQGDSKVLVGVHIEGTKCDHVGPSMSNPVKCEIVFRQDSIYNLFVTCQK